MCSILTPAAYQTLELLDTRPSMSTLLLLLLQIHPSELKPAVTDALNAILQPVRDHFAKGDAKKLLDTVRKFKVTR